MEMGKGKGKGKGERGMVGDGAGWPSEVRNYNSKGEDSDRLDYDRKGTDPVDPTVRFVRFVVTLYRCTVL